MSDVIPLRGSANPKFQLDPYHQALADAMADHMLERLEAAASPAGSSDPKPLITVEQAASYLGRHPKTILRWVREGRLKAKRQGRGLRFEPAVIERGVDDVGTEPDATERGRAAGAALAARLHGRDGG